MPQSNNNLAFPVALSLAIQSLDDTNRLSPELSARLRGAIRDACRDDRLSVAYEPEKSFGPFESLPAQAQRAIVKAIVDYDKWSLRGHELPGYPILLRMLWIFWLWVHRGHNPDSKFSRIARELSDIVFYGSRKGPAHLLRAMYRWCLSWQARLGARPALPGILHLSGISPHDLAVCYAQKIPQIPRYRGFWHDPSRHYTVGIIIGIDLVPSSGGCWFIESNLSPGLRPERSALYARDPFVLNLLNFAKRKGYRHLVVIDGDCNGVNKEMARQYVEEAQTRKLKLTIVEAANVLRSQYTQYYGIPAFDSDDTLVARLADYPTSVDNLFDNKRAHNRALALYKERTADPDLLLPETGPEPVLADIAVDEPFPNVVYKLPELDWGKGVYFLKAMSKDHARAIPKETIRSASQRGLKEQLRRSLISDNGVYQRYVKSSLLPDRRLHVIRALVLVTPQGIEFLSAHRVVSGRRVPEELAPGIVRDPWPYLVKFSAGSYEIVPPAEESLVIKAALAVGRGLAWAAEYSFETLDRASFPEESKIRIRRS